jgi:hypothetical protein
VKPTGCQTSREAFVAQVANEVYTRCILNIGVYDYDTTLAQRSEDARFNERLDLLSEISGGASDVKEWREISKIDFRELCPDPFGFDL